MPMDKVCNIVKGWFMSRDAIIKEAMKIWHDHALLREGKRNTVYADSLGKPTVGIGHLVTHSDGLKLGDKITDKQVQEFFTKDSQSALKKSLEQCTESGVLNPEWLAALISVNFQLGDIRKVFYTSWPLLCQGKKDAAIRGFQNSAWAKQTPVRVDDFVDAIERHIG